MGARWVEELGRDFTALGATGVLTFIIFAVVGYLMLNRRYRIMTLVIIAVGGGTLLSFLLKGGIDRPRPELVPHSSYVYTASFPSGHSMMSATYASRSGVPIPHLERGSVSKHQMAYEGGGR